MRFVQQTHDELLYEESDAMKEPIYAVDAAGVVHLWYPAKSRSHAGCTLRREDVTTFLVERKPTCLACLARRHEAEAADEEEDQLLFDLRRSLGPALAVPAPFIEYSAEDADATVKMMQLWAAAEQKVKYTPGYYLVDEIV